MLLTTIRGLVPCFSGLERDFDFGFYKVFARWILGRRIDRSNVGTWNLSAMCRKFVILFDGDLFEMYLLILTITIQQTPPGVNCV